MYSRQHGVLEPKNYHMKNRARFRRPDFPISACEGFHYAVTYQDAQSAGDMYGPGLSEIFECNNSGSEKAENPDRLLCKVGDNIGNNKFPDASEPACAAKDKSKMIWQYAHYLAAYLKRCK